MIDLSISTLHYLCKGTGSNKISNDNKLIFEINNQCDLEVVEGPKALEKYSKN